MKVIGIIGVIVILLFGGLFVYSTYYEKKTTTVQPDPSLDKNSTKKSDSNQTKPEEGNESSELDAVLGELDDAMPKEKVKVAEDNIDDLIAGIEDKTSELISPSKEEKQNIKKKASDSSDIKNLDYKIGGWTLKGSAKNVLIVDTNVTNKGTEDHRFNFTMTCSVYDMAGKDIGVQKKDFKVLINAGETKEIKDSVFGKVNENTNDVKCAMGIKKKEEFKAGGDSYKSDIPLNGLPAPEIGL